MLLTNKLIVILTNQNYGSIETPANPNSTYLNVSVVCFYFVNKSWRRSYCGVTQELDVVDLRRCLEPNLNVTLSRDSLEEGK